MSANKMKGLIKGLRYISQVFDDEKDQEIQIGCPTDVKHVAHIGCDGSSVESPSWLKEFDTPGQSQPAPSDNGSVVSADSSQTTRTEELSGEFPEKRRSRHRRHRSTEKAPDPDSQGKDSTTKSRHSRRANPKGSSEGPRSRRSQDPSAEDESQSEKLPEAPKRVRKKKPKDESTGGVPRPRQSKSSLRSKQNVSDTASNASDGQDGVQ